MLRADSRSSNGERHAKERAPTGRLAGREAISNKGASLA